MHAVRFFAHHGWQGFVVLGSVVLVITGGEALYADMGHFGRRTRSGWPGSRSSCRRCLLNYFGQAAWIIRHPDSGGEPVLCARPAGPHLPDGLARHGRDDHRVPGAHLGRLSRSRGRPSSSGSFPRVTIVHTSGEAEGQIYVPEINTALAVACVGLVLGFKESSALAAAYGIAVTGTMAITSIVYFVVLRRTWNWPLWRALPLVAVFLSFDLPFFGANALKFFSGGWFPIAAALVVFLVMTTWKTGRALLGRNIASQLLPIDLFVADVGEHCPHRVSGTAVFMSSNPAGVPIVLLHHWKHNQVLHQTVVLLSVISETIPEVTGRERIGVKSLGNGFFQVTAHYGFMQTPNVPQVMQEAAKAFGVPYERGAHELLPRARDAADRGATARCSAGARRSSRSSPETPDPRPSTSASPRTGSSSWGCRSISEGTTTIASQSQPLVLVIEDEAQMRTFVRIALEAYGFATLEASTAADGIRQAAAHTPDLVLLDLGLPDADGSEVTRRIREWSSLPILIISARGTEASKVKALDEGADDYITKPFGAAELMARVRVALRKAGPRDVPADVVHVGNEVRVDLANRIVVVRGKEVHFAPVEYKLLVALVKRAGRVITYRELLEQVWGSDQAQPVQTLRVYMAQLRQKLERQPARPKYLLTETGVGYRLRLEL